MSKKQANQQTNTALYVYCIGNAADADEYSKTQLPNGMEDNASLEFVIEKGLVAVTSAVPLADYSEESLREHLLDPAWTGVRAMQHEQVVEHFSRVGGIVPLRFATIYLDATRVREMLDQRNDHLHSLLKKLRDRDEWGVNIYFDQNGLLEGIASISPLLRDLATQAEQASPGQAYLLKKKASALRRDEAKNEMARIIDELEDEFRAASDDLRRLRTLKVETTEQGDLRAKFAVLLKRSRFDEFHLLAEAFVRKNEATGIRIEFAGPLPPYNFTD